MQISAEQLTVDDPMLRRACAGEWPFDLEWKRKVLHPSLSRWTTSISRMFLVPTDATAEYRRVIGVEVARRSARLILQDMDVRHFEILSARVSGAAAETHTDCDGDGCLGCNGLGSIVVPDEPERSIHVMGWLAVVRKPDVEP